MNPPTQGSTTYGIQRHVKNQRRKPCIDVGAEEVGNLKSSACGEGRNLNVLRPWRVKNLYSFPSSFFCPISMKQSP